jgi:hypothetical protein
VFPPAEATPKALPQPAQPDATDALVADLRAQLAEMRSQRDAWQSIAEHLAPAAPKPGPLRSRSDGVFIGADAGCCVTDGSTGSGKVGRTGTVITGFSDTEAVVAGCSCALQIFADASQNPQSRHCAPSDPPDREENAAQPR